jgi:hypothetical protein
MAAPAKNHSNLSPLSLMILFYPAKTVCHRAMLGEMENTVVVFRSADANAEEDASAVLDLLTGEGIAATLLDDRAPGVPSGAWEVRVDAKDSQRAEALIAEDLVEDESEQVDGSHGLDLVTVFRAAGSGAELEAMSVKAILESNGIYAMLVADSRLPNLPEEVRVPREHLTQAKRLIADALAAGPAGAEEAEGTG